MEENGIVLSAAGSAPPPPRSGNLGPLLLCFLAIGASLGWGWREHHSQSRQAAELRGVLDQVALMQGTRSDLLGLLASPATAVITLSGKGAADRRAAVVVWNEHRRLGMLLCEGQLGIDNEINLIIESPGHSETLATFRPSRDSTLLEFHTPEVAPTDAHFLLRIAAAAGQGDILFQGPIP